MHSIETLLKQKPFVKILKNERNRKLIVSPIRSFFGFFEGPLLVYSIPSVHSATLS